VRIPIIKFLRSLSFGGIVGSGIAGILYLRFPQFFGSVITLQDILIFGGALGASIHRGIDAIVVGGILHPLGKTMNYYGKLVQLEVQRRKGMMDHKTYRRIKAKLDDAYFLEENKSAKLLGTGSGSDDS
jgi:hypothetical protein